MAAFNEAHILATTEAICRYRARAGLQRPAVHRPRHARPVRAGLADRARGARGERGGRPGRRRATASPRRRRCRTRSSSPTAAAAAAASRTASSSRLAQPARRRRLQVQPAQRRPGRHRRHALDPGRGEPDPRGAGPDGIDGIARARSSGRARDAARTTSWATYVGDLRQRRRHGGDRGVGAAPRRRPAGRRGGRLLGARSGSATASTSRSPTPSVDPTFGFMTLDWDGKIRMDPSSPFAMARLVELRDRFDLALGNDADADRHGIVVPGAGLMNPNHVLAAAISYLFGGARELGRGRRRRQDARLVVDHRPRRRRPGPAAGRGPGGLQVVRGRARRRLDRLRRRGERRGVVPAPRRHGLDDRQGRHHRRACWPPSSPRGPGATPARCTRSSTERFGAPAYRRIDAPATPAQKAVLGKLDGRRRDRDDPGRRPDDRDADEGARATAPPSAG